MKQYTKLIGIALLPFFIGCGGGSSETTETQTSVTKIAGVSTTANKIAIDNSVKEVSNKFGKYKVVVYTNRVLEEKPSQSTKAIYGKINGQSTTSLLTINDNYKDGDIFVVKVFEGENLVGESDEVVLEGDVLKFNDIGI